MAQALAQIIVHIVFSTKNREPTLADNLRDDLHAYIGAIIEKYKGKLLTAGSVPNHIHLLVAHPRTCSTSELVKQIKLGSSFWLKMKSSKYSNFYWQRGYGIFSISPSHRTNLERYITNQAEHHREISFEQEYVRLLDKYEITYDERYIWD